MIADHLTGIEEFEADLWKVADHLRANSNLASNEYFMPILGLIFLRHATNRYYEAMAAIEKDRAAGRIPDRPLVKADFTRRRALKLPSAVRYDVLLEMPTSPWQNLDFSGLCSFRTLALRWPNDGFQERKTANRAGTTPRNAPKGDSWLSSAPLGSK